MTKGRKALPAAMQQGPEFHHNTLPEVAQTMEIMNAVATNYNEERDLVNQLLGQAQAFSATSQFLRTFGVSKLAYVKEHKLYKSLAGMETPNVREKLSGTWEEFCGLLGQSVDKVDADIANLKAFGEEALDSMSKMGIGYRELRQYRKLPADEKLALIEAAKSGDKDSLLDLAETLIARHTKEKEALTAELEDVKTTAESRQKVIGDKEATISGLQEKLAKKKRPTPEALAEEAEQALRDIDDEALRCVGALVSLRSKFVAADDVDADAVPEALVVQAQRAAIGRVLAAINHLADDYQIATTGLNAAPEARDQAAEDAVIWAAVNAELAAKNEHAN